MHQSPADVKTKTPNDTLLDANDEASSDTLTDSLRKVKAEKVG